MTPPRLVGVEFRFEMPRLVLCIGVPLSRIDGWWLAPDDIAGDPGVGLGQPACSARNSLVARQ
jgi:hypothetical protein